jgi:hypothetical protein
VHLQYAAGESTLPCCKREGSPAVSPLPSRNDEAVAAPAGVGIERIHLGRWAEEERLGRRLPCSVVAALRPLLPGIQVPSPCRHPAAPIDGALADFAGSEAARQRFRGWEDSGGAWRSELCRLGLQLAPPARGLGRRRGRIRRFAAQEWLGQCLPYSAVAAPRPPLPELQAPSPCRCPATLIDGRIGGLRRIGGGREAPHNFALPGDASPRALTEEGSHRRRGSLQAGRRRRAT